MSMCYLCDLCACRNRSGSTLNDNKRRCYMRDLKVIDWGKQDPHEVCKMFEPKDWLSGDA